jgi:type III pantothenate kinase
VRALVLDVGNTRLKWGIAENGEIHRTGNITHEKIRENGLGALTSRLPRAVDVAIASNVAGSTFATRLAGIVHAHSGCDLHFAKTGRTAFGVTNSYKQPRRIGVDRWVAMIGAWTELRSACLVVDAGTAVTIDALDDDVRHLGGQILPGVVLMAEALAQHTSDIPLTRPAAAGAYEGSAMFANNSRSAIGSGALGAVTGAVERAIGTLRSCVCDATLVLTGGDASRILSALDESPLHRPNLVLQGLVQMLERRR